MIKISSLTIFLFLTLNLFAQSYQTARRTLILMSSPFEITTVADTKEIAELAIDKAIAEVNRIDSLISEWKPGSETSQINNNAGIDSVNVSPELFYLIDRTKKVSALTEGAFDISFAGMSKLYNFDRGEHPLPDSSIVKENRKFVNWKNIKLSPTKFKVFLPYKGMKIGFGGVGQGFAANKIRTLIEKMPGLRGALINVSGDILAFGESIHPDGWRVQIADPKDKTKVLAWVKLNNSSLVTSGDYENFFTCKGVRYSHIINPATGYPCSEVKSATILSPDVELSDVLATSMCVMGVEKGLELVNKMKDVNCIIVDKNDKIYTSDKLVLNYYK